MIRLPPSPTRTVSLFPYTTLVRAAEAPRMAAARLEISPGPDDAMPPKPGAAAGAGFDGQQASIAGTGESQATHDVELMDLRARVSELDELQQQQQALLALKDKELAAARKSTRLHSSP